MWWANLKAALITAVRKALFAETVKKAITNAVIKLAAGSLSGFSLMVVTYMARQLVKYGLAKANEFAINLETGAKNEVIQDKYEQIINKPGATTEEIRDAAPDFLGGKPKP